MSGITDKASIKYSLNEEEDESSCDAIDHKVIEQRIDRYIREGKHLKVIRWYDNYSEHLNIRFKDQSCIAEIEIKKKIYTCFYRNSIEDVEKLCDKFLKVRSDDVTILTLKERINSLKRIKELFDQGNVKECITESSSYLSNFEKSESIIDYAQSACYFQSRLQLAERSLTLGKFFLARQHIVCFLQRYPTHEGILKMANQVNEDYLSQIEKNKLRLNNLYSYTTSDHFKNYYKTLLSIQILFDIGRFKKAVKLAQNLLDQNACNKGDRHQIELFIILSSANLKEIGLAEQKLKNGEFSEAIFMFENVMKRNFDLKLPTPPLISFDEVIQLIVTDCHESALEHYMVLKMQNAASPQLKIWDEQLKKTISTQIVANLISGEFQNAIEDSDLYLKLFAESTEQVQYFRQMAKKFHTQSEMVKRSLKLESLFLAESFALELCHELPPSTSAKTLWESKHLEIVRKREEQLNASFIFFSKEELLSQAIVAYKDGNFENAIQLSAESFKEVASDQNLYNRTRNLYQISVREQGLVVEIRHALKTGDLAAAEQNMEQLFQNIHGYIDSETNQYLV